MEINKLEVDIDTINNLADDLIDNKVEIFKSKSLDINKIKDDIEMIKYLCADHRD